MHSAGLLVVDDNEGVRRVIATLLTAVGYQVSSAANGRQALDLFADAETPPVSLVVTDLDMPELSGRALVTALRARYASLPVLFVSGHLGDELESTAAEFGAPYLRKPFTSLELLAAVQRALGEGPPLPLSSGARQTPMSAPKRQP